MKVKWTKPTDEMINELAANLRESDVEEIYQSTGFTPLDALRLMVTSSTAVFCALVDDKPVYVFGGCDGSMLAPEDGYCWGFATKFCDSHKITLAKLSKHGFGMLWGTLKATRLHCQIPANNKATIDWIKWLGAVVGTDIRYGVKGGEFLPYVIERT